VVPHVSIKDKREFCRRVSEFISNDRQKFGGIDSGDVELMSEDRPAIRALRRAFKVRGKSDIHISGNMLNGFYLPEGIILLLDL
jgi:hypothetical protein